MDVCIGIQITFIAATLFVYIFVFLHARHFFSRARSLLIIEEQKKFQFSQFCARKNQADMSRKKRYYYMCVFGLLSAKVFLI